MNKLLIAFALLPSFLSAQSFENFQISSDEIAFETSAVEVDSGIWVAVDYSFKIGEGDRTSVMRSFDNGHTWNIDTAYEDAVDPVICKMPDGSLIMVLQHMSLAGSTLELHRSTDNGDHFIYYSALPSTGFGDKPWIGADDAGHLYATWTEIQFGFNTIGFARSDDGGVTWAVNHSFFDAVNVFLSGSFFCMGQDENVYLTWGESTSRKIFFTVSNNLGDTWSEPFVIAEMTSPDYSPMTFSFASQNSDYVGVLASMAHNPLELLFLYSDNGGADWHETTLDTAATNPSGLIQPNGAIHISYTHFPGDYDIGYFADTRYISSTDGGLTFSTPISLLTGDGDLIYSTYTGEYSQLQVGKDTELHATWVRKTTDIGFTHTIIDIPRDTTGDIDTTVAITSNLTSPEFMISPNPATDYLHISGIADLNDIRLYNQFGQQVFVRYDDERINISNLPAGLYSIMYQSQRKSFIKR